MTSPSEEPIKIDLFVQADRTALLEGLEQWLQLGLLSDAQVRAIGQLHLTCPLPAKVAMAIELEPATELDSSSIPVVAGTPEPLPVPVRSRSALSRSLSALMAEISVIWLLFLGVFLVVVSSGVLAASQWQNFSAIGQYAILFGYTLVFWFAGTWAARQPNLQLTGRMLQLTTLLIIPVNFWMIDGFQLWQTPGGWIAGPIAGGILSLMTLRLLGLSSRWVQFNALGLSWLHWGWAIAGFPLLATYGGTIGTAFLQLREENREAAGEDEPQGIDLGRVAILGAVLLLVGRAVLGAGVPVSQLGLAFGLCGWLLGWLNRRSRRPLWTPAATGLLLVGWAVTVTVDPPWQAIVVSGLGLGLLADRLHRRGRLQDLTAGFLVGLQAYCLLWRLIPDAGRQTVLTTATRIAGTDSDGWELLGLGILPFVGLTVLLSIWLRRWQQLELATHAERMALTLGGLLAIVSGFNPLVRFLYLLLSTGLLGIVLRQRPSRAWLVYLTHTTGLLTVMTGINWQFPALNSPGWIGVLLGLMAVEWGLSGVLRSLDWRWSAWHLGLVLAALSYPLLLEDQQLTGAGLLLGLIPPTGLTVLGRHPRSLQPRLATILSIVALLLAQVSPLDAIHPLMLSCGIATGLMVLNTQRLPDSFTAFLTIGFGLSCTTAAVLEYLGEAIEFPTWLGIALWGLWLLRDWAIRRDTALLRLYANAANAWAVILCLVNFSVLTIIVLLQHDFWSVVLGAGITTGAIAYRLWQRPTNLGFYGLAWGTEILLVNVLQWADRSWEWWAIAHLMLGLGTQLAGDFWVTQRDTAYRSSWHGIPLFYAVLGWGLAHHTFTATTGLYTLAAALIGIGVGRRRPRLKPLTYLAILGISIAAYELLIYQLMQVSGGAAGDGITLLAGLAAGIALADRLLARWLCAYWRLTLEELHAIAHLHWLAGSGLAGAAVVNSLSSSGEWIWISVVTALAGDAIWQGRRDDRWVYAGVAQGWIAFSYWLYQVLPEAVWIDGIAAIAAVFALGLYHLPWRRWGWSLTPWQQSALVLPIVMVALTSGGIALPALLIVGAFYAWMAKTENRLRLSYISIFLADWALLRLLLQRSVSEPFWYMAVVSASLLFIAQIDPSLRSSSARDRRHFLRSLAVGLLCLAALYQPNPTLGRGLLTIVLGIGFILAGLVLRTRAFLFMGTLTFVVEVLRQLWLFINTYSLLLWAMGILLGLAFIWIAATFEARRSQAIALVQHWLTELDGWE